MKHYKANTRWAVIMTLIITALCQAGGYFERGYFTFDGGCVLGILLLIATTVYYQTEKEKAEKFHAIH